MSTRMIGWSAVLLVAAGCASGPRPGSLAAARQWWDTSAASPRSPVDVSFVSDGDNPYSCVREDGAYWTRFSDDTGVRIEPNGRITSSDGPAGEIDARGVLHLAGSPASHLDSNGNLYCDATKKAFARIDAHGVILRQSDGHRIAALHGNFDWRKNLHAALLLLIDGCSLAGN